MKMYSIFILTILTLSCGSREQSTSQEVITEAVVDRHQAETQVAEATTVEVKEELSEPTPEVKIEQAKVETSRESSSAPISDNNQTQAEEPPVKPSKDPNSTTEAQTAEPQVEAEPVVELVPDHSIWQTLLQKYVTANGKVNYRGIKAERAKLKQYLDHLAANPIESSWSRNQKLAYWINAYNAFTVELILQHYPLKSIMDLEKPWDKKFIKLGSSTYSLNQIEHEIVRPQFKDARIHFALVCAAASCPKLLNHAYTESKVQAQLDTQTRYFLNRSGKNTINADQVAISQLFNWYGDDFKTKGSIIDYLNQYSETKINANAKINFTEYDWTLNE